MQAVRAAKAIGLRSRNKTRDGIGGFGWVRENKRGYRILRCGLQADDVNHINKRRIA